MRLTSKKIKSCLCSQTVQLAKEAPDSLKVTFIFKEIEKSPFLHQFASVQNLNITLSIYILYDIYTVYGRKVC